MKKNIVFMTAVKVSGKESRSLPYKFGIESFKRWCDNRNYQLIVLDQEIYPSEIMKPNFYRYFCFDLLDNSNIEYDQILLTDADAIIHPDCPDFFELTNREFTVTHTDGNYDWTTRSMENYAHEIFGKNFDIWKYFNAGFIILNKSHRELLKSFTNFYIDHSEKIRFIQNKYKTGTDQPLINHFVHNMFNIPVNILPYRYCMADLYNKNLLHEDLPFTSIEGIYQFNAIPNNVDDKLTYYWMEKTFNMLFK